MKTKSLSIFLVALFVVEMNLGAEENNNKNEEGEDFKYKIMNVNNPIPFYFELEMAVVGKDEVGKTQLGNRICRNIFLEEKQKTIGFELNYLYFKIKNTSNELVLRYQIWDCCGQAIYRSLVTTFCKKAKIFLFVYDVTNEESFEDIKNWLEDVNKNATKGTKHFVLIGTKIDLEKERKISKEDGEKFAEENGMKFVEVSAKTGNGIKDLEDILAKIIYKEFKKKKKKKKEEDESNEKSDEIEIENDIKVDYMMGEEPTHSSSLCDCCKKICENC